MITVPSAALMRNSVQPDDSVATPATRSPAIAERRTFRARVFIADLLSNRKLGLNSRRPGITPPRR
jgi:hypothetical protein